MKKFYKPTKGVVLKGGVQTAVRLTELNVETANRVGNGNVSAGIRHALDILELSEEGLTIKIYQEILEDHKRLIREIDVALNGEAGAALRQVSLVDILAQIKRNQASKTSK